MHFLSKSSVLGLFSFIIASSSLAGHDFPIGNINEIYLGSLSTGLEMNFPQSGNFESKNNSTDVTHVNDQNQTSQTFQTISTEVTNSNSNSNSQSMELDSNPLESDKEEKKESAQGNKKRKKSSSSLNQESNAKQKRSKNHFCSFNDCTKAFESPSHLKNHERTHTRKKPFPCTHFNCGKAFKQKCDLKNHECIHTGQKPFTCTHPDCRKTFIHKGDFNKHERTHTGVKPFPCTHPDCGKAFTQNNALIAHQSTHTKEKPFKCTHANCGRTFPRKIYLKYHEHIHTGEKPFKCMHLDCGKAFARKNQLNRHKRNKHPSQVDGTNRESSFPHSLDVLILAASINPDLEEVKVKKEPDLNYDSDATASDCEDQDIIFIGISRASHSGGMGSLLEALQVRDQHRVEQSNPSDDCIILEEKSSQTHLVLEADEKKAASPPRIQQPSQSNHVSPPFQPNINRPTDGDQVMSDAPMIAAAIDPQVKQEDLQLKQWLSENKNSLEQKSPEVLILKRIKKSVKTPEGEVFNQDGARLYVGDSKLVPGQKGLFAAERIEAGKAVTRYTGKVYRSNSKVKEIQKPKPNSNNNSNNNNNAYSDPDPNDNPPQDEDTYPNPGAYLLDVTWQSAQAKRSSIKYYIDGFEPDPQFGGSERCLGTYINHSEKQPNVEFQIRAAKGTYMNRAVAIVSTQIIEPDQEILVYYGDAYHEQLKASGALKE